MTDKINICGGCGKTIGAEYSMCAICAGAGGADKRVDFGNEFEEPVPESNRIQKNARRRYAKTTSLFEVGVWSAKSMEHLLFVMLGSMDGIRNSYNELGLDNRRLRYELENMGLAYADNLCGALSPDSHEFTKRDGTLGVTVGNLWHNHGFMKFPEIVVAKDLHSVLSPLWGNIHGSQVVDVKIVYDEAKAIKYCVKEAMKDFLREERANRRLFMSRDWLPEEYRKVDKLLNVWALYHGANWNLDDDFSTYGVGEYIPYCWLVKRELLRDWCHGESLDLDMGDYVLYITGCEILKYQKENGGKNDEKLL